MPNEMTQAIWWIETVIAGLVPAITVILAFALSIWAKKKHKEKTKEEFKQALYIDLKRILIRLIKNSCALKARLGEMDSNSVKWMYNSFLEFDLSKAGDPIGQEVPMPENINGPLSDDEANMIANNLNKQKLQRDYEFARLPKIEMGFIESNLPMISLLIACDQQLLFSIISRIQSINSWISKLEDQYEMSFTHGGDVALANRITANKKQFYYEISNAACMTANEIMDFCRKTSR